MHLYTRLKHASHETTPPLVHQLLAIMGQFFDYLASVFSGVGAGAGGKSVDSKDGLSSSLENSFSQAFRRLDGSEKLARSAEVSSSNKRIIIIYQTIGAIAFLAQFSLVTVPKIQLDNFDISAPESWQPLTLSLVPLVVYVASISALQEINRPLNEGAKMGSKNAGLDLNNNDFGQSLKVIILLMVMCQVSSIFSDQLIWSVVLIVPIWVYLLTSRVAQAEYERHAPGPKKQWVKLNVPKSPPKSATTPSAKQQSSAKARSEAGNSAVKATPRTRTKRAVKNIITGVTDKYHAFEQNVAQQISQKVFPSGSPFKAIQGS